MASARPENQAQQLAEKRRLFELAMANDVTMEAARALLVRERWAESERRLAIKRGRVAGSHRSERPEQWWQRL
ncbi:hypothetical protein BH09PSE4_BH09PSE4_13860 [soil metagenome]